MFTTRTAGPQDAGLITQHRRAMFEDMRRGTAGILDEMSHHFQEWVSARLAEDHYLGWITEEHGKPVASAGMLLIDFPPAPQDPSGSLRGHLLNVYVDPQYRSRGLARALVQRCMAEAQQRRIRVLSLHASDKGRPLYESLGFHATNEMQLIFTEAH